MITDFIAQVDNQQHERELTETLERRRAAADGGDALGVALDQRL